MPISDSPPMFRSLPPTESLAPFVRRIMIAHHTDPVDVTVQPAPTGFNYIGWIYSGQAECDFGDRLDVMPPSGLNYAGQILSPVCTVRYTGRYGHVIVETTATGFAELTHVPAKSITEDVGLFDLVAHPWAADFAQRADTLGPDLAPEDRVACMIATLEKLAAAPMPVPDYIRYAARRMTETAGLAKVSDLVDASGVCSRHFTREFTRMVGVSPKNFCLTQQINKAIALWHEGNVDSLTELAHAAGYYDQPHLNRSFRKFFSGSPGEVLFNPNEVVFEFVGHGF